MSYYQPSYTVKFDDGPSPWVVMLDGERIGWFDTEEEAQELADEYNRGTP